MSRRLLEALGVAAVLVAVVLLLRVARVPVDAQSQQPPREGRPGPTTPWGDPDLQGIWTATPTPLQRPAKYANKNSSPTKNAPNWTSRARPSSAEKQRVASAARHRAGRRRRLQHRHLPVAQAHRPANVAHRRSAGRAHSADDAGGEEAETACASMRSRCCRRPTSARTSCPAAPVGSTGRRRRDGPRRRPYYMPPVGGGGRRDQSLRRSRGSRSGERCMGGDPARLRAASAGSSSRAIRSIFYDTGQGQGWQRVIPITDAPHLPVDVRQWWGDSRGHWEGNTLVVDVTNFSPKSNFQGARENLHLVERWTRVDANTLEYTVTIEDPTTGRSRGPSSRSMNEAGRQGESHLQRAAMSRGQLRHAGAAGRARAPKSARSRRERSRSGDDVHSARAAVLPAASPTAATTPIRCR